MDIEISVITINLNNKEGLRKTIESVISQGCTNFEYIIIDGGSIDGSIDIIKEYSEKFSYWISECDNGIYSAMNKGINIARGKYCIFLNSGDFFYSENVLEKFSSLNLNEDIIYGQQFIIKNGKLIKSFFLDPNYITLYTFTSSTLPHQCTFIRRELFFKIGLYNERNRIISDWEWNLIALFKYNCSLRKIEIPISVFDTNGISNSPEIENIHNREKHESLTQNFPRIVSDIYQLREYEKIYNKIPRFIIKILKRI